ncbi:MAG: hypothetical protein CMN30_30100 [Sandaracinus sp.]|nr:hypothetical protein [Sandaracinus sp.]
MLGLLVLGGCTVTTSGRATVRTTASASVVTTPTYVTIAKDPPPPRAAVAVRPAQPRAGAVWVEGYWAWNSDWVWVDGHWDSPPQTGFVWEPPVVVAVDAGGYQYHRGYWRRRNNEPPAVYRTAGTIRVHVRAQNDPVPVSRVVVRRGSPPPRQVVVRGGAARGNSSRVVVRQAPAQGRTNVRVRTQGNARTEVRGNGRTDVRVRTPQPSRPEARGNANVRVRTETPRTEVRGNAEVRGEVRGGNDRNERAPVRVRGNDDRDEARGDDDRGNGNARGSVRVRGRGNARGAADPGNQGRRSNDERGNGGGNNGRGRGR